MTNEMRELRVRWQGCRQALLSADYNHADEELARVLHFAENTPLIARILKGLRALPLYSEFDAQQWLSGRGRAGKLKAGQTNLRFSLDEKERSAQCLKLLEFAVQRFREGQDGLFIVGQTTYGGRDTRLNAYIHSAIDVIFDPFYHYVDTELRVQETLITPTDIMNQVQALVDGEASPRYPKTHGLLVDAYHQLFTLSAASSGASWYQVGFSCRQTLVCFANEVFDPSYVPGSEDQPKGDDARGKLKWTTRHHLKQSGAGNRYRECVEKIIQTNWNFVNTVGHRQESVTEDDARLAIIYTYLTVWLVDRVLSCIA
jgi:hypothetical protein